MKEKSVANSTFIFALVFFIAKSQYAEIFNPNMIEISVYSLIIVSALFTVIYVQQLKKLFNFIIGGVTFFTLNTGIMLAGTRGLGNDGDLVIEGLSRIIMALVAIWKLQTDLRFLKLELDSRKQPRTRFGRLFYGILYPPKEIGRLIKIAIYVFIAFYFVTSGLKSISAASVDIDFFANTEKISINLLFIGIQTPMMMASRASVSRTFSNYMANAEWAIYTHKGKRLSTEYESRLDSDNITYDSINSNGKHLWLSVLMILLFQAFEQQIADLNLEEMVQSLVAFGTQLIDYFN